MPRDGLESRGQSGKSPGQRIQESSASGKSPKNCHKSVCLSAFPPHSEPPSLEEKSTPKRVRGAFTHPIAEDPALDLHIPLPTSNSRPPLMFRASRFTALIPGV